MPYTMGAMSLGINPAQQGWEHRSEFRRRRKREDLERLLSIIGGVGQVVGIGRGISGMVTDRARRGYMGKMGELAGARTEMMGGLMEAEKMRQAVGRRRLESAVEPTLAGMPRVPFTGAPSLRPSDLPMPELALRAGKTMTPAQQQQVLDALIEQGIGVPYGTAGQPGRGLPKGELAGRIRETIAGGIPGGPEQPLPPTMEPEARGWGERLGKAIRGPAIPGLTMRGLPVPAHPTTGDIYEVIAGPLGDVQKMAQPGINRMEAAQNFKRSVARAFQGLNEEERRNAAIALRTAVKENIPGRTADDEMWRQWLVSFVDQAAGRR